MTDLQMTNSLAHESITIIKDLISENDLVRGVFIADARLVEDDNTIIIKDVSNQEIHYSISEVSCIFTDYLDMLGSFDKSAYKTVLAAKSEDKMKNAFMKSYKRLREIEQQI